MPGTGIETKTSDERLELSKDDWEEWMDWEHDALPQDLQVGRTNQPSSSSNAPTQTTKTPSFSPERGNDGPEKGKVPATDAKVQDRSHSVVEKRYRENLNQKIAELGECIPKLRTDPKRSPTGGGAPQKRNKAKVLTEAMSYIRELEKRNAYLEEANTSLKRQTLQQEASSRSSLSEANPPPDENVSEDRKEPSKEPPAVLGGDTLHVQPQGMIPIPEAMRRLWRRDHQNQEHYADDVREPEGMDDF